MARYAIGDIQGCYDPFRRLLDKIEFTPENDVLWIAGDLVNRGPDNLNVLRFLKELGDRAVCVLGNHDLHLLAAASGARKPNKKDTLADVLKADDCEALLDWLRYRPLIHIEDTFVMSHAGVPHIWDVTTCQEKARLVEQILQSEDRFEFYQNMYGDEPKGWEQGMDNMAELRVITNYFTRMRVITKDGQLDLSFKDSPDLAPRGMSPWYDHPRPRSDVDLTYLFGHWAAIDGSKTNKNCIALDTGCVWGGNLTAMRLEDRAFFTVPASRK